MEAEAAQSPEEVQVLAAEAMKHGLFLPQGQLQFDLQNAMLHPDAYALAGLWRDGVLCGLGLVEKEIRRCQAYVLPEVRRLGAGRRVMEAALAASGCTADTLHAHPGDSLVSSMSFWRAMGIAVWPATPGVDQDLAALVASCESSRVVVPLVELLTQDMLGNVLLALPPSCLESPTTVAERFLTLMAVAEGSHAGSFDFDVRQESAVFEAVSGVLRVALGTRSDTGLVLSPSLPLARPAPGWASSLVEALKAWSVQKLAAQPKRGLSMGPR